MVNIANTLKPSQVPDILPDYLPGGGISLLAGAPTIGKTALLAGILRDLQAGRPVFGRQPRPVAWGYINSDRSWEKGAGLWLRRAGVTVPFYSLADDPDFDPKRLRRKFDRTRILADLIDRLQLPTGSGLIVDPMSLWLGGNLLDYDTCAVACAEIRAYLRPHGYTLFGLVHSGKLKADKRDRYVRTSDQILGSTAIAGFTDAVLHLAGPEELGKGYYQLVWHPHGAKAEVHRLDRDEQGLFIPWEGADRANVQRVLNLFPEPPTVIAFGTLVELAEAIPLSRRTVKYILDDLIDEGKVQLISRGVYARVRIN